MHDELIWLINQIFPSHSYLCSRTQFCANQQASSSR
jgi:hypothetical protein